MAEVVVFPSVPDLAGAAADFFVEVTTAAIAARGRCVIALSGGSTPQSLYSLLARPAYSTRIDWRHVHLCWGDERCVPPGDPASNFRMTRAALLDRTVLPAPNIHRMRGEDPPPLAASAYERELRHLFATPSGPPRYDPGARFDLVLLGMGANGHTASLFPQQAAVREEHLWVMAELIAEVAMWRMTLTPPILNAAAEILFLVAGRDKAVTLQRVLQSSASTDELPAKVIAPHAGRLRWFVDASASTPSPP